MTLAEAKKLRDEIRVYCFCTVPLGYGPSDYFARIFSSRGVQSGARAVDFHSREAWLAWKKQADAQDKLKRRCRCPRPRSPIEAMIDRACGLSPVPSDSEAGEAK